MEILGYTKTGEAITVQDAKKDLHGWDLRAASFTQLGTDFLETRKWASEQYNLKKQREAAGLN